MSRLVRLSAALLLAATVNSTLAQAGNHNHETPKTGAADATFAQREREVMPFDLEATTHIFGKTSWGGTQQVKVLEVGDTANLALIRSHLKKERARFSQGVFADPAYLHGADMAGLGTLQKAAATGRLAVNYRPLPDGAELVYEADGPEVTAALHRWFEAQVADHRAQATMAK